MRHNYPLLMRMPGRHGSHRGGKFFQKEPLEEQMGLNDDSPPVLSGEERQNVAHRRLGHRQKGNFGRTDRRLIGSQPGKLVHFGSGGFLPAAATDEQQAGLVGRHIRSAL
jgi:hypothetical protein